MKLKGTTRVLQLGSQHAVIMLSTEKDSAPIISVRNKVPNGKKILLAKGNLTPSADTQYEHLYFTSNNEITEGDWYIDDTNTVRQSVTSDKNYWSRRKDYKKIVATTDTDLRHLLGVKEGGCAAISDFFVTDYIKSHNDNKPISEVDLDIELHKWLGSKYSVGYRPSYQIKTAPDNTVIVLSHNQSFWEESSLEVELKVEIKNLSESLQDMVNEFSIVTDAKNEIEQEFAMNNAIELLKKYI